MEIPLLELGYNGTDYNIGDIVIYDGFLWTVYCCSHAGTTCTKYLIGTVFAEHIKFVTDWLPYSHTVPGALVKYNGIRIQMCNMQFTAGTTLEEI